MDPVRIGCGMTSCNSSWDFLSLNELIMNKLSAVDNERVDNVRVICSSKKYALALCFPPSIDFFTL